jgi:uncharacterized membrane protein YeaQ/YmgE (transglycosylase-associated protein family)
MYFLSWIIVGLIAGWSAGKILNDNAYGPLTDIAIGIGGAVAGGFLMRSAGFSGYRGTVYTTLAAIIGAELLTLLAGLVNGRRMYARQL